jgi:hypothetical protein
MGFKSKSSFIFSPMSTINRLNLFMFDEKTIMKGGILSYKSGKIESSCRVFR